MTLSEKDRAIRQKLKDDFKHYASKCLYIRAKSGKVIPFVLNDAQLYIHDKLEDQLLSTGKVRALILKGRQQGCSTYVEGRYYWRVTHTKGYRAFILTHDDEATSNIFDIAKRYHDNCPTPVKPSTGASSAKELNFNLLDSGYKVGTAGNKAVGRGSTVQLFHGSEVAFWPHAEEHAAGILQAVPNEEGTEDIRESTANGVGNYFHKQWQMAESGESDYIAIFVPWYWQKEYTKELPDGFTPTEEEIIYLEAWQLTMGQILWRRHKILELGDPTLFKQEYPACAAEAFQVSGLDPYISPESVLAARKGKADGYGPKALGVDPARFGDDRNSLALRQGRVCHWIRSYAKKMDLMEVVGIVKMAIEELDLKAKDGDRVFIDIGGLGAGVYDRLCEVVDKKLLVAVNFGGKPFNPQKFCNKRAEMWGLLKEWLNEEPVSIPDSDELHADLTQISYSYNSNSALVMEKKEVMKKRGLRSPDCGDSLGLTFAQPLIPPVTSDKPKRKRHKGSSSWMG